LPESGGRLPQSVPITTKFHKGFKGSLGTNGILFTVCHILLIFLNEIR
jgi:hypothetical protein